MAGGWNHILPTRPNDVEGDLVRAQVNGVPADMILDVACGDKLTVEGSLGIDKKKDGIDLNEGLGGYGDKKYDIIIARHILEHLDNPHLRIAEWRKALTLDGKLIIVCPNEELGETIRLDPTHKHAFTPAYLNFIIKSAGGLITKQESNFDTGNFMLVVE